MSNDGSHSKLMPAIFVGHGSPMNAIGNNEFSSGWREIGKTLPRPKVILSISAHWVREGSRVTAMDRPKTIYDFYGFPKKLYQIQYPAPGAVKYAELTKSTIKSTNVGLSNEWGLDHGTWVVLMHMYPKADIPTFQLSLDYTKPPIFHYKLGQELKELRKKDVLIIGSGNCVHNLGLFTPMETEESDWAIEFDEKIKNWILNHDHKELINYESHGNIARLAIPTNEHYLPLLYILGMQDNKDILSFKCERIVYGSISMRCLILEQQ